MSNWERYPLSKDQIIYAALDAWIGVQIYQGIDPTPAEMRDLVLPDLISWFQGKATCQLLCSDSTRSSIDAAIPHVFPPLLAEVQTPRPMLQRTRRPSYESDTAFKALLNEDWEELADDPSTAVDGEGEGKRKEGGRIVMEVENELKKKKKRRTKRRKEKEEAVEEEEEIMMRSRKVTMYQGVRREEETVDMKKKRKKLKTKKRNKVKM